MDYQTIIVSEKENVTNITLNRPDKMNALNQTMLQELATVTEELGQDDKVKAIIIGGAGRAFCAGADLDFLLPDFSQKDISIIREHIQMFQTVVSNLRNIAKPVIAAVNGAAVGAGCNYALACDIIIASEKARFGQVFANVGLHPDSGGAYLLPRLVGVAKACELIFTGKIIDAEEAERIGLVNQVVPAELLETTAKELAQSLAKGPSVAIGLAKTSIYQSLEMNLASALECETRAQCMCFLTQDAEEGIRAFLEKREPAFTGR